MTIELTADGAVIVGIPTLAEWGASLTQALNGGATATWQRTDLIGFAEEESPYDDEQYQELKHARVSPGGYANDARRYRRFPRGHALRRFIHECGSSHFDAVAPLSDIDAEIVLATAAREDLGREWVRSEVLRRKNQPVPLTHKLVLAVDGKGNVTVADGALPQWCWGHSYDIVLKEKAA